MRLALWLGAKGLDSRTLGTLAKGSACRNDTLDPGNPKWVNGEWEALHRDQPNLGIRLSAPMLPTDLKPSR
ncbi:hypothetical protein Thiowin_04415 [Thiorhodovibrio winogradskyi]|uniref:Uncharacterized protein n=1 Tax=Thiorhodovibrio winogradskyi TaxID=77007 RepID=A0ABZ0SE41_9GAMM